MRKAIIGIGLFLVAIGIGIWIWPDHETSPDGRGQPAVEASPVPPAPLDYSDVQRKFLEFQKAAEAQRPDARRTVILSRVYGRTDPERPDEIQKKNRDRFTSIRSRIEGKSAEQILEEWTEKNTNSP